MSALLWHGKSLWCQQCFAAPIAAAEAETVGKAIQFPCCVSKSPALISLRGRHNIPRGLHNGSTEQIPNKFITSPVTLNHLNLRLGPLHAISPRRPSPEACFSNKV